MHHLHKCLKCGAIVSEKADACRKCGHPLPRPVGGAPPPASPRVPDGQHAYCVHCGTLNDAPDAVCSHCARPVLRGRVRFCRTCGDRVGSQPLVGGRFKWLTAAFVAVAVLATVRYTVFETPSTVAAGVSQTPVELRAAARPPLPPAAQQALPPDDRAAAIADAQDICAQADALFLKGSYDEAIALYRRAAARDPRNAAAYRGLGSAYAEKGTRDQAITAWERSVRIDPSQARTWYDIGVAYCKQGDRENGARNLREAAQRGSDEAKEYLLNNGLGPWDA